MTIKDKIQSWCDSSIDLLVNQYDATGRRASGNWEKELESLIEPTKNGYNVKILGSKYTYWIENGRLKNKNQDEDAIRKFAVGLGINAIYDWITDKGLIAANMSQTSLAIAIAYKIAKEGYTGKPLISEAITDAWIEQLVSSIGMFLIEDIRSEVLQELKAA